MYQNGTSRRASPELYAVVTYVSKMATACDIVLQHRYRIERCYCVLANLVTEKCPSLILVVLFTVSALIRCVIQASDDNAGSLM